MSISPGGSGAATTTAIPRRSRSLGSRPSRTPPAHTASRDMSSALPEDILPQRRGTRNPIVLVGAALTGAVLCAGFVAFKSGNTGLSQHMMRARIVAQGATVALMVGTSGAVVMPSVFGDATK